MLSLSILEPISLPWELQPGHKLFPNQQQVCCWPVHVSKTFAACFRRFPTLIRDMLRPDRPFAVAHDAQLRHAFYIARRTCWMISDSPRTLSNIGVLPAHPRRHLRNSRPSALPCYRRLPTAPRMLELQHFHAPRGNGLRPQIWNCRPLNMREHLHLGGDCHGMLFYARTSFPILIPDRPRSPWVPLCATLPSESSGEPAERCWKERLGDKVAQEEKATPVLMPQEEARERTQNTDSCPSHVFSYLDEICRVKRPPAGSRVG